MAYEVTEECICCGDCVPECPVEAIAEGTETYIIDINLCNDCGACIDVCPVDAIRIIE